MINALLDLYETTFNIKYFNRAIELNTILLNEFWDHQNGGFYFTSVKSEKLIARQKEVYDGAIPSGNSIALLNLLRLARFTSNTDYETKAAELINYFSSYISKSPSAFSMFMCGLDFQFSSSTEIVIISEKEDEILKSGLCLIRSIYNPNKVLILKSDHKSKEFLKLFRFTTDMKLKNNKTTFYVCQNYACNQPVDSLKELKELLSVNENFADK